MHPKEHQLLKPKNLLELIFQSPFWLFFYGTGLILPLSALAWGVYGLGLHIHPKLYPLPHIAILDLLAETMIWIRVESTFSELKKKILVSVLAVFSIGVIPVVFLVYLKYLFWLWLGEGSGWLNYN